MLVFKIDQSQSWIWGHNMAITSKTINLSQLDAELGSHGLSMNESDPKKKVILPADNSPITETELEAAIANHVAVFPPSIAEAKAALLAKLGISEDEAKLLLA